MFACMRPRRSSSANRATPRVEHESLGGGWQVVKLGVMRGLPALLLMILPWLALAAAEAPSPADQVPAAPLADATVDAELAWQVYRLFQRSCANCHSGHRKPKGGFGFVLDLPRLARTPDYVMRGNPDASYLYEVIVETDPEFMMPPQDAEEPRLTAAEAELVRAWIAGGAGLGDWDGTEAVESLPQDAGEAAATSVEPVTAIDASAEPGADEPGPARLLGKVHPLLVHFPIALLIAALLAELVALCAPSLLGPGGGATRLCLWIGTVGAVGAVVSGWLNAAQLGYAEDTVFLHRWLGVSTAIGGALTLVLFELSRSRDDARLRWTMRILLLITVFIVASAGHGGGELVYGEGYLW